MGGPGRIADWIELSCLLSTDGILSKMSVIDHLVDSGLLSDDPERAEEQAELIADNGFADQRLRARVLGDDPAYGFPFQFVEKKVLSRRSDWQERVAYLFLLLISFGQLDSGIYGGQHHTTYDEIGHLFERIVACAAAGLFRGPCEVLAPTGASKMHKLGARVATLLKGFGLKRKAAISKVPLRAKDCGLDVLSRLEAGDGRPGSLHVLVQCAAGANWEKKLGSPSLADWRDWVQWRGPICKGFAVPTLFGTDGTIENASRRGEWSIFIDRVRILHGIKLSEDCGDAIIDAIRPWCERRVTYIRKSRYAD